MPILPAACSTCDDPTATDVNVVNTVCVSTCGVDFHVTVDNFPALVNVTVASDHAEDSPHVSGDIGSFALAVRNDAGTNMVSADGDYAPLQVDSTGALRVTSSAVAYTGRDDTDNQAPVATGLQTTVNRLYTFDGTNWDRVRSGGTPGAILVDQGTSPWIVSGTVTANQGTSPWVTSLDAATLAALETITVLQGTSPWVVSGTVELGAVTLAALETITVLQGTSPWVVSGTVTSDVAFDYAEDSPHVSGDIGAFVLAVRNDANTVLTSTNGDYSPFSVTSTGALNIADAGGSITVDGTVELGAATLAALETITVLQGTSPWVVSGTVAVTQSTSPWVVSGTVELGVATLAALETITVLQGTSPWVVSGTVTSDVVFDYAEDSPHVSGDIGAFVLAVRNDANAVLTSTNGDYSPFSVTSSGALNIADGGGSITVDGTVELGAATLAALETITVLQGTSPWVVSGTVTADTELPAAAALTDDEANPTVPRVGSMSMVFDGTTWDRTREATADAMAVTGLQGAANQVFNGTTWDRMRSGTATGSVLVNNPTAANFLATVTQGTSPWVVSGTVTADTELPAASALADADPNPTTSRIGANGLVFNGTTWDRVRSGTALGSILVNNGVAANLLATVTQGTSPWVVGAEKAEDSGHTSGQTGNFVLGVRNDAGAVMTSTDLDYSPITTDSTGAVRVTGSLSIGGTARDDTDDQAVVATGAGLQVVRNYVFDGTNWDRARSVVGLTDANAGTGLPGMHGYVFNGTTWDRIRSGAVTGMQGVAGAEAHDAPVTGNPVLTAGRGSGALPTAVSADGDVTRNWNTLNGRQRVYNSGRRRQGIYMASLGNTTVTAAADAATAGRFWLVNNSASITLAVRKIFFSMTTGTGLLTTTAPVFTVERMTFTGTPSGATVTPAKRDAGDANASGSLRTASTGMTITAGAAAHGFQVPASLVTTSANTAQQLWPPAADEDEYLTLAPGAGIVIRQSTAGTALDTRICNFDIIWEEFNTTDYAIRD